MDSLPNKVIDTESKTFYSLDSAAKRGEVIDKGIACLSYIWNVVGNGEHKQAVIDGVTANPNVKRDLTGAIEYAKSIGIKYLWIDALCIDQNNSDEIEEKVQRMHIYFTVCNLVMVWTAKQLFRDTIEPHFEKALKQFVDSSWLDRSWTIQEGVLANRLVVATDWGLIFPDALHEQDIHKNMKPGKGLLTLLKSRHKRAMIASEVLELSKGREPTRMIDRVLSLSAMLPYTKHLQLSKNNSLEDTEDIYLNAIFAVKDVSPLCCFINDAEANKWSWRPKSGFFNTFPDNIRLCAYSASQAPRITTEGLRIEVKVINCVTGDTEYIHWEKEFPESRALLHPSFRSLVAALSYETLFTTWRLSVFRERISKLTKQTNGILKIANHATAAQIVLFVAKLHHARTGYTESKSSTKELSDYISKLHVITLDGNIKSVVFFDDSKSVKVLYLMSQYVCFCLV